MRGENMIPGAMTGPAKTPTSAAAKQQSMFEAFRQQRVRRASRRKQAEARLTELGTARRVLPPATRRSAQPGAPGALPSGCSQSFATCGVP